MAARNIASAGSYKNPKLCAVRDVEMEMEKSGKFKYVLIKVHDPDKDREFKHIVRGSHKSNCHHKDIHDEYVPNIELRGLDCECVGGGRIQHEPSKKSIHIYGYSDCFGRADHTITHAIIQRKFGADYDITVSNDGY